MSSSCGCKCLHFFQFSIPLFNHSVPHFLVPYFRDGKHYFGHRGMFIVWLLSSIVVHLWFYLKSDFESCCLDLIWSKFVWWVFCCKYWKYYSKKQQKSLVAGEYSVKIQTRIWTNICVKIGWIWKLQRFFEIFCLRDFVWLAKNKVWVLNSSWWWIFPFS